MIRQLQYTYILYYINSYTRVPIYRALYIIILLRTYVYVATSFVARVKIARWDIIYNDNIIYYALKCIEKFAPPIDVKIILYIVVGPYEFTCAFRIIIINRILYVGWTRVKLLWNYDAFRILYNVSHTRCANICRIS